jgi:hypothetical protein
VVNTGTSPVNLAGWKFDDEDNTNWGAVPAVLPAPSNAAPILNPNQVAVFYDEAFATDSDQFKSAWSVPDGVLLVPVSWGSLKNSPDGPGDEVIQLLDNVNVVKDVVNYDDNSPWPTGTSTRSIYLKSLSLDNNNGANWAKSAAGTAKAVSGTGIAVGDVGSPGRFFLGGDYSNNGYIDIADYVMWRKTETQTISTGTGADGSGATFGVPDGSVNQFDYVYWRANFGVTGAATGTPFEGENLGAAATLNEPASSDSGSTLSAPVIADINERAPAAVSKDESNVVSSVRLLDPVMSLSAATTGASVTRLSSAVSTSSIDDDLLLALLPGVSSSSNAASSDGADHASDHNATAIDELFASLEGLDEEADALSLVL